MSVGKNVFVIIATYNCEQWYRRCLGSLRQSAYPVTTIVVDNASTDEAIAKIKSEFPEVVIYEQATNLGFGQANNLGIQKALESNADYCFLLNQDAWVEPETIGKLVEVAEHDSQYWILSPIHLNGTGDKLDAGFVDYIKDSTNNDLLHDAVLQNPFKQAYEVPFVNAAAWMVSREAIETIGLFDKLFFHYGEDVNYCQRVLFHGGKIVIIPGVFIYHGRSELKGKMNAFADKQSFDKYIKMLLADVNRNTVSRSYKKLLGQLRANMLMSLLSFDFKRFRYWKDLLLHVNLNKSRIDASHRENRIAHKRPGMNMNEQV